MKAVKTNGEEVTLQIGQGVCGTRFSSITFTSDDVMPSGEVAQTRFSEWVTHLLLTRVMTPRSK